MKTVEQLAAKNAEGLLREGIAAAKAGDKERARELFHQVTREHPQNDVGWLCLASATDSLQVRLTFLQKASELNPSNTKALELIAQTKTQFARVLVQKGTDAAKAGDQAQAQHYLLHAAELDPRNESVWMGLVLLNEPPEERSVLLQRVLEINPANARAREMLSVLNKFKVRAEEQPSGSADAQPAAQATATPMEEPVPVTAQDTTTAIDFLDITVPPAMAALPELSFLDISSNEVLPATPERQPLSPPPPADPLLPPTRPELTVAEPQIALENTLTWDPMPVKVTPAPAIPPPAELPESAPNPTPTPAAALDPLPAPRFQTAKGARPAAVQQAGSSPSCPLCLERLDGQTDRCASCNAQLTLRGMTAVLNDPLSLKVDQRKMLLAVTRCSKALAADSKNAQSHYEMGLAYLHLNRKDIAIRCFRRTLELRPDAKLAAWLEAINNPQGQAPPPSTATAQASSESSASSKASPSVAVPTKTSVATGSAKPGNAPAGKSAGAAPTPVYSADQRLILVVDDSPTVRKLVTMTLEKNGHRVITATDGLDALDKLNEVTPDMILLDIMMPKLDGYQTCKIIRETKKDLPVVMLSDKDRFFDKVRGKMSGSTAYITKPFEPETLLKMVREYTSAK